MTNKCKKGYKKVGGRCVSQKSYKVFGKFADEFDIVKVALIGAVISIGGWLMFSGLLDIFGLVDLNGWIKLGIGFIFVLILTKFGLNRK
jgi:predicted tellurium resistance membrane protein TerC